MPEGRPRAVKIARYIGWTVSLLCAFSIWAAAPSPRPPAATHVLLISIDGLGADWYPAIRADTERYPTLNRMLREGSHAERMVGVFPTLTYPSHASIVTGAWPAQHGVPSNYDRGGGWVLEADQLTVPPLWDVARRQGLQVALVNWPITYGADVDYLIPQNLDFHASDLADQIRSHSTPGLFEDLEQATGAVVMLPFLHHDAGYHLDNMTGRFAAELVRRHTPNLLLAHFLDLDHRQHMNGTSAEEAKEALAQIDAWLGKILAAVDGAGIVESTAIVVVGDHGFSDVEYEICLPTLLQAAELPLPARGSPGEASLELWMARASVALRAAPELNARQRVAEVIAAQLSGLVSVLDKQDLERLKAFPDADFALAAVPGYIFSTGSCESLVGPSALFRGAHGYLPHEPVMAAGMLAMGAGIRPGHSVPEVRMVDIAPTIAQLLGLEFAAPAGRVIDGIISAK